MRCCDSGEPVEAETSETGLVASMGFCFKATGWETACGLYIWKIPKHLHTRLRGCALSNLAAHAFCLQKVVLAMFQRGELRGERMAIYITLSVLMRELTLGQPAGRMTGFMS